MYKRQDIRLLHGDRQVGERAEVRVIPLSLSGQHRMNRMICLLYTSDAADERSSVDLGGRRIIKKKTII